MPETEEAARTAVGLDRDYVRDVFRAMLRARILENKLSSLYKAGKIKPYVSETFTLAQGADAIRHLTSRKAMGKVVVTMG